MSRKENPVHTAHKKYVHELMSAIKAEGVKPALTAQQVAVCRSIRVATPGDMPDLMGRLLAVGTALETFPAGANALKENRFSDAVLDVLQEGELA